MNRSTLIQIVGCLIATTSHCTVAGDNATTPPVALLPYDRTNPVMYDNDYANDYVDWYLMAVASAGDIQYQGISTSSSVAPFNKYLPPTTSKGV